MQPKPGAKTTEFWMHLILQIFFVLNTAQVWTYVPTRWSAGAQVVLAGAYAIARGLAKINQPLAAPPQIYPIEAPPFENGRTNVNAASGTPAAAEPKQ